MIDIHNGMYLFNAIVMAIGILKSTSFLMSGVVTDERKRIVIVLGNIVAFIFIIQTITLLVAGGWVFRDLWHIENFLNGIVLIFIYTIWRNDYSHI